MTKREILTKDLQPGMLIMYDCGLCELVVSVERVHERSSQLVRFTLLESRSHKSAFNVRKFHVRSDLVWTYNAYDVLLSPEG